MDIKSKRTKTGRVLTVVDNMPIKSGDVVEIVAAGSSVILARLVCSKRTLKDQHRGPLDNKMVMVCGTCLTASCWYGEFMCDDARSSNVKLIPFSELVAMNVESSDNWSNDKMEKIYGSSAPFGYSGDRTSRK